MEELVFDGTDAGLHADAVRRLFTESKVQDPASEVISTNMDNTAQLPTARRQAGVSNWPTGGEVVEFTVLDAGKPFERNLISLYAPDSTTHCGFGEAISLNSMVPCALLALDCVAYAMALPSMRSIGERNCSAETSLTITIYSVVVKRINLVSLFNTTAN